MKGEVNTNSFNERYVLEVIENSLEIRGRWDIQPDNETLIALYDIERSIDLVLCKEDKELVEMFLEDEPVAVIVERLNTYPMKVYREKKRIIKKLTDFLNTGVIS